MLRFDHVITQNRVNEQLAKKHLLGYKGRDMLSNKTKTLFESLREFKRLHVHWGLTPLPDQDPEFKESLDSASATFNKAVETITVFAALNVVYEMADDKARLDSATDLISKKKEILPPSLTTMLQQILDDSGKQPDKLPVGGCKAAVKVAK